MAGQRDQRGEDVTSASSDHTGPLDVDDLSVLSRLEWHHRACRERRQARALEIMDVYAL